ncbi:MAG: hypothetical protein M3O95_05710 [Candidatus Dormibacteraeota bacterium]|jgi:hypothetical protein|nr:hypothetical protein [Candidatus Dormibacteraeota bacterium]MDQ6790296.1 hypothetical protein [Candidatus Dormibacteraeota bacterium]
MTAHDLYGDRKGAPARRREQVRHLIRSVGVELEGGARVPFFVEPTPGRFKRNPSLRSAEINDEQLCTLKVPAEIPAKIPTSGLPVGTLKHLIDMGVNRGDEL